VLSFQLPKFLSLSKQLLCSQYPLLIDNIIKGFIIYYVNNWLGIEFVNFLLPSYTSRLGNRNITTTYLTTDLVRLQKLSQGREQRLKTPTN
jgi:hypothetical protein